MRQIREIMAGPVLSVEPDKSAADAARLMRDEDTGDVVVAHGGKLKGIITDRDLAVRLVAEDLDPSLPVGELCTSEPITISPEDSLHVAAERALREHALDG